MTISPSSETRGCRLLREISPRDGYCRVTYPFLTWATEFIDYDNDGWKDIFLVNGHVYPQADKHDWGTSYAQRPLLFHNVDKGKKFEVDAGRAWYRPGRGHSGARSGLWRSVQRRKNRRRYQLHRPYSGVDAQCQPGSSSLGWAEADWRTKESARRCGICRLSDGRRDAPTSRRDERRKLRVVERSARALRYWRCNDSGCSRDSLAEWSGREGYLPSVDRFFVLQEGKGIVSSVYDSMQTGAGAHLHLCNMWPIDGVRRCSDYLIGPHIVHFQQRPERCDPLQGVLSIATVTLAFCLGSIFAFLPRYRRTQT